MTRPVIGRLVRIVSLSFGQGKGLDAVTRLINASVTKRCDVIALPETWAGQGEGTREDLDGPIIARMAELARAHHTYIVCPIDRCEGERRFNTSVLLDRRGEVAGYYNKAYPYWSEFDINPPVQPGSDIPVFETDFGRLGLAICFDVNFPVVWQHLADQGAEVVIWSSAYSAGTSLQPYALLHHYYIVTSTLVCDCLAYDITGQQLYYRHRPGMNVSRIMLNLDRGIYHENFNLEKRERLLSEHGAEVVKEHALAREQWFVLKPRKPGINARALARQYGLEELRDYINRSRMGIDARRGSPIMPT
jgi:predicted amidohydrolase